MCSYMCAFSCSDVLYLEVAASRHIMGHTFAMDSQEPLTGLWSFVISVSNSVKSLLE